MKLSDIKGEAAIDATVEIIDPVTEIVADKEFKALFDKGANNLTIVKYLLKNHKKEVLHIMAVLDGEDPATYQPTILSLPFKLMEIMSDENIQMLFRGQGQKESVDISGSVMVNTEASEN